MSIVLTELLCKGVGENCTFFIECCDRMTCVKDNIGLLQTGVCACIDNFEPGADNNTCEWKIPVMITVTLVISGIVVFAAFALVIGCLVVQWV
ncbi:Hypothetical predicted protein [Cloeon dipterum]|uniref:Uncharacterized protein n=1 Tax=Cloeon dipterum TaxID=197152 RepID=A0A8S1CU94_9INSE|nr:Hypothetical predicted protein [Cloeon dipterum]